MRRTLLMLGTLGCAVHAPPDWDGRVRALEAERVAGLEDRIARTEDLSTTAPLWHRLGEARVERARRGESDAMDAWRRTMDRVLASGGYPPSVCVWTSDQLDPYGRDGAALALAMVGIVDPAYPRGDEALASLAAQLDEMNRPELALQARQLLLASRPDSAEAPETWLLIGERHFDRAAYADAREAYAAAIAGAPQGPHADFARYKHAWTQYLLDETEAGQREMLALAASLREGAVPSYDTRQNRMTAVLREEALRDLVWMLVYADHPEAALATIQPLLGPEEREPGLRRLEQTLRNAGFETLAAEVAATP